MMLVDVEWQQPAAFSSTPLAFGVGMLVDVSLKENGEN